MPVVFYILASIVPFLWLIALPFIYSVYTLVLSKFVIIVHCYYS